MGSDGANDGAVKALVALLLAVASSASADEGGVSFWLPGQFSSFAAVPGEPGWSLPITYYHGAADAGAEQSFVRGGRTVAGLDTSSDVLFVVPTYVFATPIAGQQASISMRAAVGRVDVASGGESDTRSGLGDLYPSLTLRSKNGVHHTMTYTMVGVPSGAYQVGRLASLGTNHWSLDGGGGYTYLNKETGREFSGVLGFTYNFRNPDTDYRNGLSSHLDWAASQFFSPQWHAGVVGYWYTQLAGDSGNGATLGDFKSRVAAVGPQLGFVQRKLYVNLKGYYEFAARNRPEGWNAWLTLSMPL